MTCCQVNIDHHWCWRDYWLSTGGCTDAQRCNSAFLSLAQSWSIHCLKVHLCLTFFEESGNNLLGATIAFNNIQQICWKWLRSNQAWCDCVKCPCVFNMDKRFEESKKKTDNVMWVLFNLANWSHDLSVVEGGFGGPTVFPRAPAHTARDQGPTIVPQITGRDNGNQDHEWKISKCPPNIS